MTGWTIPFTVSASSMRALQYQEIEKKLIAADEGSAVVLQVRNVANAYGGNEGEPAYGARPKVIRIQCTLQWYAQRCTALLASRCFMGFVGEGAKTYLGNSLSSLQSMGAGVHEVRGHRSEGRGVPPQRVRRQRGSVEWGDGGDVTWWCW